MVAHGCGRSALLAVLLMGHAASTQDTSRPRSVPTFRSSVSEVQVTFFATDGKSRRVENLTKADVAIVDNGTVVRTFHSFARTEETSLHVVTMVDVSESAASRLRAALDEVRQLVSPEQSLCDDKIAVLSFAGVHPAILCSDNCWTPDATRRLVSIQSDGLTPLYDALVFGARFVAHQRRTGVRPVLILFSDGNDTISLHSAREAMEAALASNVLIYAVDVGDARRGSEGQAFLRWVSGATGGRYLSLHEGALGILKAVREDLRASYVVTYDVPRRQAGFHSVELMPTHNLKLRFHNRSGYYFETTDR